MMATVNAAHAIGQKHALGRISPGFRADLIAIPCAQPDKELFEAIAAFADRVQWMMVDGRIIGDS